MVDERGAYSHRKPQLVVGIDEERRRRGKVRDERVDDCLRESK